MCSLLFEDVNVLVILVKEFSNVGIIILIANNPDLIVIMVNTNAQHDEIRETIQQMQMTETETYLNFVPPTTLTTLPSAKSISSARFTCITCCPQPFPSSPRIGDPLIHKQK